jgi:hypothetical protein
MNNRYIGDSTRLVYDIMSYTENNNIDGLLTLIDFENSFDSISWHFIYKSLDLFNFGPSIKQWVKLFNNNITAYIAQFGHLSQPFNIERGCRQDDPISSYLFINCAQILYLMFEIIRV